MKYLVTGGAGFIGSHLVDRLLGEGHRVTVVDNFDPFYDPAIKEGNIAQHLPHPDYRLVRADLRDAGALREQLDGSYDAMVHLAACAGVRPSILEPAKYQAINVGGTQNLLELAREWGVEQFVFASSSSVYGTNPNVPWREDEPGLRPISPYASTKVSCELLGHVYSHLYGIRFIGLRFFTVYGPRQRPDLAIHKFARMIAAGEPIPFHGDGTSSRDYTFIDDIIAGVRAAIDYRESAYEIINLGNDQPVTLSGLVELISAAVGREAVIHRLPDQPGDVPHTRADIGKAKRLLGYQPATPLATGIGKFVEWLNDSTRDSVAGTCSGGL
jgi:UDP-glucuronate 4-epimerase